MVSLMSVFLRSVLIKAAQVTLKMSSNQIMALLCTKPYIGYTFHEEKALIFLQWPTKTLCVLVSHFSFSLASLFHIAHTFAQAVSTTLAS